MPDWVISAIIQYPIVVVIGYVAWYAYRELKTNTEGFREHERKQHADMIQKIEQFRDLERNKQAEMIQKLEAAHKLRIESKNAEIKRLEDDILGTIKELADAVAELKRKIK